MASMPSKPFLERLSPWVLVFSMSTLESSYNSSTFGRGCSFTDKHGAKNLRDPFSEAKFAMRNCGDPWYKGAANLPSTEWTQSADHNQSPQLSQLTAFEQSSSSFNSPWLLLIVLPLCLLWWRWPSPSSPLLRLWSMWIPRPRPRKRWSQRTRSRR